MISIPTHSSDGLGNHTMSLFTCNFCEESKFCDKKLRTHSTLRYHMKILHPQFVSNCKSSSECKFGPKKCWFLHQEDIEIAYQNAKDDDQKNDNEINYDME